MELTRRAILGALGGLAVGGTVASVVGTSIAADPKTKRFEQINGDFGWKPAKLDPKECAAVAYDGYWHKGLGCAYGAFYAIVGLMGEKIRRPVQSVPLCHARSRQGRHLRLGHHLRRAARPRFGLRPFLGKKGTQCDGVGTLPLVRNGETAHLQPRRSRQRA